MTATFTNLDNSEDVSPFEPHSNIEIEIPVDGRQYYVRVAALDPDGSGIYGDWSETTLIVDKWKIVEDGSGDFTSLVTALADPYVLDVDEFEISGPWEDPDAGLVDGTAIVYSDSLTITATGEARYPGYPVENPTHWRVRKTTLIGSAVIHLGAHANLIMDGLDIAHDGGENEVDAPIFTRTNTMDGAVTVKNSILHRTVASVGEYSYGFMFWDIPGSGLTLNLENTQICNLLVGIDMQPQAAQSVELNINSSTITKCGIGFRNNLDEAGTVVANIFNSIIAGNTTADISVHATSTVTLDAHNSIDSDGSLGDYDLLDVGCLASRTVTDDRQAEDGAYVIFRNITTLPYDLRMYRSDENDAYEMHSEESGAGRTIPSHGIGLVEEGVDLNSRSAPFSCGANETPFARPGLYISKTESPTFSYSIDDDGILVTFSATVSESGGTVESDTFVAYMVAERSFSRIRVEPSEVDERIIWNFSLNGSAWSQASFDMLNVSASVTEFFVKLTVDNSEGAFTDPGGGELLLTDLSLTVKGKY